MNVSESSAITHTNEVIEYRVTPVQRFNVTRYTRGPNSGSSETVGEYPSESKAMRVARAFAMHDRWELSPAQREVIFDDRHVPNGPVVGTHTDFPSRYAIGDEVIFQPDISAINGKTGEARGGVRAKIVGVEFGIGKVFYDLAVADPEGGFYEVHPLRRVDSYLVCDLPSDDASAMTRFVIVKRDFEPNTVAYYASKMDEAEQRKVELEAEYGADFRIFGQ